MPMYFGQASALASPPVFTSGRRYNPSGGSNNSATMTLNRLYLWLWRIDRPVRVNSLGLMNASAVVGTAKFGLYTAPSEIGGSGTLLREGASDVSTNVGVVALTDTITAIDLSPGYYCGAVVFSAAAVVFASNGNAYATQYAASMWGDTSPAGTAASGGFVAHQTAAVTYTAGPTPFLPATLTALTRGNAAVGSPTMDFGVA